MEAIRTCAKNLHSEVCSFTLGILVGRIYIGGIIIDLSNCKGSKLDSEIIKAHKEGPIFMVGIKLNSFFFLGRDIVPALIIIRPSTFEFTDAPWIS